MPLELTMMVLAPVLLVLSFISVALAPGYAEYKQKKKRSSEEESQS